MGSGGSIPEVMSEEDGKKFLGDLFDADAWAALADSDGNVTADKLREYEEPEPEGDGDDDGAEALESEDAAGGLGVFAARAYPRAVVLALVG